MIIKTMDASFVRKCFLAGANAIDAKKEVINDLNVFPVPDGDTGTNMTMTIMSAAKEVAALENPDMKSLGKAISGGSLRGARGNSGVILSQLLRGFTKEVSKVDEVDVDVLTKAFERAVESAYKAVMKPKEGTILTVARGGADKALELNGRTDNIAEFMNSVIMHMRDVLDQTPELLPVLKEAGVVDSGGQGLMEVIKGCYDAFLGKEVDLTMDVKPAGRVAVSDGDIDTSDIKFGYCTEFIVMLEKPYTQKTENEFKEFLSSIGDSIVCVNDEDIVKVHVHTNDPGLAIQRGLTYGSLTSMKIDNMREEHQEKLIRDAEKLAEQQANEEAAHEEKKPAEPRKAMGFIAVSIGAGMNEIFKELGADYIIEGGQTMNPSTEDMLNAIDQVNADMVFILPNNKNIILAANQAKSLVEDKEIIVIPTKTVPQGITAIINFMPDADAKTNEEAMLEEIKNVKTGQMTYAVRDTHIDDKEIHEGDIMGIGDSGILAVGKDLEETTKELIANLVDEDSELISIYYGEEVSEEDAEKFTEEITELYPDVDVDIQFGGQPIYYYVLAVE